MTGSGDDGQEEREIKAGQTGEIESGEWIVEQPSEKHSAANEGDQTVVIYLANLIKENAEASTPVPGS